MKELLQAVENGDAAQAKSLFEAALAPLTEALQQVNLLLAPLHTLHCTAARQPYYVAQPQALGPWPLCHELLKPLSYQIATPNGVRPTLAFCLQGTSPAAAGPIPGPYAWKLYFTCLATLNCHARTMSEQLETMIKLGVTPQASAGSGLCFLQPALLAEARQCQRDAARTRDDTAHSPDPHLQLVHTPGLQPACYAIALRQMAKQSIGAPAYTTILRMKVGLRLFR